ncbi:cob(II)yrinic acid a,c-diamide reductase [Methylobacterium sp. 4-46]|uniref:5,6-dimethylbenzimidazole synthase n=1 Tax=unclassified Methylobacterium TaxID=2615210 RepID=UPI000165C761|nr:MULTISPECIES: 5,6-dimethylbenzimidazole synthase [Methylobacterium]ACA18052.1 cob(II)yrinic acid a,c-diamide reductase [Methylobacterium sp. 4-46]WFT77354.1 5,6-dimethylbenzimidazole synthase [Methylobacterium nodulans]
MTEAPAFDAAFRERLADLVAWRRDVRRFRPDPVPEEDLRACLALACLSPSVGNSQPWRFVRVGDPDRRRAVTENFARCNDEAARAYPDARAAAYRRLKLEGLREAPVHLAVFCDEATESGHGLGRATMPEMLRYSVVLAIHTFWLATRSRGLGVGWVSILDPAPLTALLGVPEAWRLVAYLCVGYPQEEHADPELVRHAWQPRLRAEDLVVER